MGQKRSAPKEQGRVASRSQLLAASTSVVALLAAGLLMASPAIGAELQWDGDPGTPGPQADDGFWRPAGNQYWIDNTGTNGSWNSGDTAVFGGNTPAGEDARHDVRLDGVVSVGGFRFDEAGYVISGDPSNGVDALVLSGTTVFATVTNAGDIAYIQTDIQGGPGQTFAVNGDGQLILTEPATFQGRTIVAGDLLLGGDASLAGTVVRVRAAGTFENRGTVDSTFVSAGASTNGGTLMQGGNVLGGTFVNTGIVQQTLTVNGGTATNNNQMNDVRVATGGDFINNSAVNGTLFSAGTTGNDGTVTGLTTVAAGILTNDGTLAGGAVVTGGQLTNRNSIVGDLTVGNGATVVSLAETDDVDVGAGGSFTNGINGEVSGTLGSAGQTRNAGSVTGLTTVTAGRFVNSGNLNGGATVTGGRLDTSGAVGNTLTVTGGAAVNTGGAQNVRVGTAGTFVNGERADGTPANVNGTLFSAGTTGNSGTVTGRTTVIDGTLNNSGTLAGGAVVTGGQLTNRNSIAGQLTVGGGTVVSLADTDDVDVRSGGSFTNGVNGQVSGTLDSAGQTRNAGAVTGLATVTDGTLNNTGNLNGGATVTGGTLDTSGTVTDTLTVTGGSAVNTGDAQSVRVGTAGTFVNGTRPDGTPASVNGTLFSAGMTGNRGTVTMGTTVVGGTLNNSGTLAGGAIVTGGQLTNRNSIDGQLTVGNGGTVVSLADTDDVDVRNGGSFVNGRNGEVDGDLDSAGDTRNSGRVTGLTTVTAGSAVNGGMLEGGLDVTGGGLVNGGTVSGPVAISGGVVVNNSLFTDGASVSGGRLENEGRIEGETFSLRGGEVVNNGTIATSVFAQTGGTLTGDVDAGLTITAIGGTATNGTGGEPTLERSVVTGAPGGGSIAVASTATIGSSANNGAALALSGDGPVTVDLAPTGGTPAISNAGDGIAIVGTSGTVDIAGNVDTGGTALRVAGANVNFNFSGGTLSSGNVVSVDGPASTVAITNSGLFAAATFDTDGPGAGAAGSVTLENSGTVIFADASNFAGQADAITNDAAMNVRSGASVAGVETFTNTATVTLADGATLSGSGPFVNSGSVVLSNGATIGGFARFENSRNAFATGNVTLSGISALENTGRIDLSGNGAGTVIDASGSVYSSTGADARIVLDVDLDAAASGSLDAADRLVVQSGNFEDTRFLLSADGAARPLGFDDVVLVSGTGQVAEEGQVFSSNAASLSPAGFFDYSVRAGNCDVLGCNDIVLASALNAPRAAGTVSGIVATQNAVSDAFFKPSSGFVTAPLDPVANDISLAPFFRSIGGGVRVTADGEARHTNNQLTNVQSEVEVLYGGYQLGLDGGLFNIGGKGGELHIGLTGGQMFATAEGQGFASQTDLTGYFAGVYGIYKKGPLFIDAQLRQEWSQYEIDISDDRFNAGATDVDGRRTIASLSGGYGFKLGKYGLTPVVGYTYSTSSLTDLRTVDRSNVLVDVEFDDRDSHVVLAGLSASRGFLFMEETLSITPFVSLTGYHDFAGETDATLKVGRVGDPLETVTVNTTNPQTYGELSFGAQFLKINGENESDDRVFSGNIRTDVKFGKETLGAAATVQFRVQF